MRVNPPIKRVKTEERAKQLTNKNYFYMKALPDFQYALDLLETVLKDGSIDKSKMLHHKTSNRIKQN